MDKILTEALNDSISYDEYIALVAQLAKEGKSTAPEQTDALADYTLLNDKRMKRWNKVFKLPQEALAQIGRFSLPVTWLVITESWCGDASPALPVMNKIAVQNPQIALRIVLRDQHPELMQQFLTNGAMSIPKLIQLQTDTKTVLGTWGPRSRKATALVQAHKEAHGSIQPEFKEELQMFYNKDKGRSIMEELLELLALK
ncbi:thioredoxin family protein [Maribacter sp. 2307ULW6-5]|uniref:thioredoxin family protein n=1 Tax=Maribacter sp. 2307ULW6-5 TaxID=3386275 RepID=UPI0039BCE94D